MNALLPFGALCTPTLFWSSPVRVYQPPASDAETALWSAVHLYCLTILYHVASKILPSGQRERRVYRSGNFVVALKRVFIPAINRSLARIIHQS